MKTKNNFGLILLIIIIISIYQTNPAKSEDKFALTGGLSFPELISIGAKYRINQTNLGFSIGTFPLKNNPFLSLSTDISYHFAGNSIYTTQKPWYAKVGLDYIRDENLNDINEYIYLNTQIGREFNISQKVGISTGLGAIFQLSHYTHVKKPDNNGWNFDFNFPILPAISIILYYRI